MGGIKIVCTKNWTYGVEVCSFFVVKKSWLAINFNDFYVGFLQPKLFQYGQSVYYLLSVYLLMYGLKSRFTVSSCRLYNVFFSKNLS